MSINPTDVTSFLLAGLEEALTRKGQACLVLSGGSSPLPVFAELAKTEFAWDKVIITVVDERAVPPSHADSNEALVRRSMMQGGAAAARFVPLFDNSSAFDEIGIGDAALLGMGTDGHFASLFPDMIGTHEAFALDVEPAIITTGPQGSPRHPRISMNLSLIHKIPHCCLLLPNAEKQALFERAKTDDSLPVHYLHKACGETLTLFS